VGDFGDESAPLGRMIIRVCCLDGRLCRMGYRAPPFGCRASPRGGKRRAWRPFMGRTGLFVNFLPLPLQQGQLNRQNPVPSFVLVDPPNKSKTWRRKLKNDPQTCEACPRRRTNPHLKAVACQRPSTALPRSSTCVHCHHAEADRARRVIMARLRQTPAPACDLNAQGIGTEFHPGTFLWGMAVTRRDRCENSCSRVRSPLRPS
jgi:hypothetical protein